MVLTNADIDGAWTLQSTNTALEGRQHDGGFWAQANVQNSSLTPMQVWRSGVVPSSSYTSIYYDLLVAPQGTPSLSLTVNPGTFVVSRAGQAVWQGYSVAAKTVTVANADPTNPRLDLIVARVEDTGVGDANLRTQIQVITGVPAASPVAPATPLGAVPLATARVNALATTITSANLTDVRKSAALNGAIRTMLPGDSLADVGFRDGDLRDTGLTIDRWADSSSSWRTIQLLGSNAGSARYEQTVAQLNFPTTGSTTVNYNNAIFTSSDVSNAAGVLTLNRAGLWSIKSGFCCTGGDTANTGERLLSIVTGSASIARDVDHPGGGDHSFLSTTCDYRFTAGQTVWATFSQNGNATIDSRADPATFISATWLRP